MMGMIVGFFYENLKLGVFGSQRWRITFLGAMALGELLGSTINVMKRKNYLAIGRTRHRVMQELHYDHGEDRASESANTILDSVI